MQLFIQGFKILNLEHFVTKMNDVSQSDKSFNISENAIVLSQIIVKHLKTSFQ